MNRASAMMAPFQGSSELRHSECKQANSKPQIVKKSEPKAAMTFIRTSKIHVNWLLVKSLIALKPLFFRE
jgi:hypothetical protein